MRYIVRVRQMTGQWYVYAPAFGVGRFVAAEDRIRDEARSMIARCGTAAPGFRCGSNAGAGW